MKLMWIIALALFTTDVWAAHSIKNHRGRYLYSGLHGELNGGAQVTYDLTSFSFERPGGGSALPMHSGQTICIRGSNRRFVVAEGGGGRQVNVNRAVCGPWELWKIWKIDAYGRLVAGPIGTSERVAFQANNGQYMTVEMNDAYSVNANRNAIGSWEMFIIQPQ